VPGWAGWAVVGTYLVCRGKERGKGEGEKKKEDSWTAHTATAEGIWRESFPLAGIVNAVMNTTSVWGSY
jgi:hypothetical protein